CDRVRHDARDPPGGRRPRGHGLAGAVAAGRTGEGRHEGPVAGRPRALRVLPLAALRRVAVVRHDQGPDRARLAAPPLERLRTDRVLRLVRGPPRRARGRAPVASPVPGPSRVAQGAQAPAVNRSPGADGAVADEEPDVATETGVSETAAIPAEAGAGAAGPSLAGATVRRPGDGGRRRTVAVVGAITAVLAVPLIWQLVTERDPLWYPLVDLVQIEMRVRD